MYNHTALQCSIRFWNVRPNESVVASHTLYYMPHNDAMRNKTRTMSPQGKEI